MKLIVFFLFFVSCTSRPKVLEFSCQFEKNTIDKKALLISIQSNSYKISNCLKNFLKFNHSHKADFKGCVRLLVSKSGIPRRINIRSNSIPKDLKMCIEQELWTFKFENLYLDNTTQIEFPIDFKK